MAASLSTTLVALAAAAATTVLVARRSRARKTQCGSGGCGGDKGAHGQDLPGTSPKTVAPLSAAADGVQGAGGSEFRRPFVIGVGGASGSGKTSFAAVIRKRLEDVGVSSATISCDSYYITLPDGKDAAIHNFDEPDALEFSLLAHHLKELKAGRTIQVPDYDFTCHKRVVGRGTIVEPTDVVFLEGILALSVDDVRDACDMLLFTTEDPDVCLTRRILRDMKERARSVESVVAQYLKYVKPGYHQFVLPSMGYAHMIVPNARDNEVAIDAVVDSVWHKVRRHNDAVNSAGAAAGQQ